MDREDGEMSDDSEMSIEDKVRISPPKDNTTVIFKAEKDGLVIQKLEKVDASKLEERAKRFGLNLTGNKVITQKQIDELYENFGVDGDNERHFRIDTVQLNGVDGLTTKEIFEYLEDYKPLSLEWIDDVSCNVVCQDHISAALALLVHSREIKSDDLKSMISIKSNYHWREGVPHPKRDLILMRFATKGDKIAIKKPGAKSLNDYYSLHMDSDSVNKNPWGDLCKSWGIYDHQENYILPKTRSEDAVDSEKIVIKNKKLAMRLGKRSLHTRNYKSESESSDDSDSEIKWKERSKLPRMRMHADDEELKIKKKKGNAEPSKEESHKFAPLSIEVENSHSHYEARPTIKLSDKFNFHNKINVQKSNIRSRLGDKLQSDNDNSSNNDESSEDSDSNTLSQVQIVRKANSRNVWSRLDDKPRRSSDKSDLRLIIKSRKKTNPNDLRDRLGKTKKSNLRIEIDNHYSSDS